MNSRIRSVLLWWLIQFSAVWIVINLFTVIPYIYFTSRDGDYYFHTDKSPVTAWEYFIQENYRYDMFLALLFLLFAELNYQYLFKRLGWGFFTGSCLAVSLFSFILLAIHHPETLRIWGVLAAAKPIILMAAYAFGYAIIREYLYQLKYKKDVRLQQSENELNSLKAQLNPHFLFNSLNYLYGTALKEQASQTADGIDKLSEMLRYTVTGMDENFVPFEKEISFIENFIAIQKARLPEKDLVSLELLLDGLAKGLEIAPMLLLTFVENAFKHGISTDQPCYIHIRIEGKANHLSMETSNRIIRTPSPKGSNTGIRTALKRLELLYPEAYTLNSTQSGDAYKTVLSLKLKPYNKQVVS